MGRLAAGRGRATDAAIIPQHIVAHTPWTYVLLLCLALGACPYTAFARQLDTKPPAPPPAPLLPAEEAWNVSLPSPAAAQGALDGLRVYIPLESGQLIALDRETGANEWSVEFSSSWPPIVSNGVVYVAGAGQFQAVGAERGDLLWRTSLDAELMTGPVLQGDSIVVHIKPGQLIALRTADGSEKWRTTIEERAGSPAMAADATGVVVSSGARLSRFATGNGELEWTRELAGVLGRPVVAGDWVFVGSTDNYLYAIEVTTGRVAWRYACGWRCRRSRCGRSLRLLRLARQPAARASSGKRQPAMEAVAVDSHDCAALDLWRSRSRDRQQANAVHVQRCHRTTHCQLLSAR